MELPEFKNNNGVVSSFETGYDMKGKKLNFKLKHVMEKRIYEAEDWKDFRAGLVERKKVMNSPIVLER